ncbi:helix-turn-helix domain-containing protein [Ureibacillus chungkukjangi]|uniref:helix-turn-helix domain-containing protein n=1 Tax=Ureibacillus chungkukjangi TaxID=1202712 RepID=UPI00384F96C1
MVKHSVVNLALIKCLRIDKNISVEEMSKMMGYQGYQGYYYKENGTRKMSADDIAKISVILEVPINELFFENEVTKTETL